MHNNNNYLCSRGVASNCDSCCPKPEPKCPKPPVCHEPKPCIPVCREGRVGISANSGGLADMFAVGIGREDFVANPDGTPSGLNYIPWWWFDPSMFPQNNVANFTEKIWSRCDGTTIRTEGRNKINVVSPAGDVLSTHINPFSLMSTAGSVRYRVVDSSTATDAVVTVPGGDLTLVEAGTGIDITPVFGSGGAPSGFRITNTSLAVNTVVSPQVNTGITVTGSGTGANPYVIGINCATLVDHCGLVTSVNGVAPDPNGNVTISTGSGGGVSGLFSPDNSILITAGSAGVLNLQVNDSQVNGNVTVANNGTAVGTRNRINFIPGTGVTLGIADDAVNGEVDVTINATASTTTNTLAVSGANLVSTVNGVASSVPLSSLGGGSSYTVQYQDSGANVGSPNPTIINFTGTINATASGSTLTVDVPPTLTTMGGSIEFTVDRSATLPAGSTTTFTDSNFISVFGVTNTSPSNFNITGSTLTIQPGKYLIIVQAECGLDTAEGTVNNLYNYEVEDVFAVAGAIGETFTRQNVVINGGGNNGTLHSRHKTIIIEPTTAQTINLSTAVTSGLSRAGNYTQTNTTRMITNHRVGIFKLA